MNADSDMLKKRDGRPHRTPRPLSLSFFFRGGGRGERLFRPPLDPPLNIMVKTCMPVWSNDRTNVIHCVIGLLSIKSVKLRPHSPSNAHACYNY